MSHEEPLLYSYEIIPQRPLLPVPGVDAAETLRSESPEVLSDVEFEPRINKAERLDYTVAAFSGVLAGLADAFLLDEFSFDRAHEWGREKVEDFVVAVARTDGYEEDGVKGAIKHLEDRHHIAADGATSDLGGGNQHHLRDFSHHCSPAGLACSIYTQFSGKIIGTDTEGRLISVEVPESHLQFIGDNLFERIYQGAIEWFFHIVSDMAGSSSNPGEGTGVPGPILSLMKELSSLPVFKDARQNEEGFRRLISRLANGTQLAARDESGKPRKGGELRFDLRTEIGAAHELGRQAVPVVVNQCIVRGYYFATRLCREIRALDVRRVEDLSRIDPEDVLPFNNPAVRRMLSVSSGVFVAVDAADAAIRAWPFLREGKAEFVEHFVVRVNFVGVGAFCIALALDVQSVFARRKRKRFEPAEASSRAAGFRVLELGAEQARLLHSLECIIVEYDISCEQKARRKALKEQWLEGWRVAVTASLGLEGEAAEHYFLPANGLYPEIRNRLSPEEDGAWRLLVALEAACFNPYIPLGGERDGDYEKLRLEVDYLDDIFCNLQPEVSGKEVAKLRKAVASAKASVGGSGAVRAASAVAVVVVSVAAGFTAFALAPAVAPILVAALGADAVAGLSGAALTSASLAFLGGGALASGGAGMVGGATVIAGGGALLGAAAGKAGVSSFTSLALAADDGFVLSECAKLQAFCEVVLIEANCDAEAVEVLRGLLNDRAVELSLQIEAIEEESSGDEGADEQSRKTLKALRKSHRYMAKCNERLEKIVRKELG